MNTDQLSNVFSALSDPTRRAILGQLSLGPKSVQDLAKPYNMTGPAVTKHLKVLERAGLISQEKNAQFRPRTLNAEPLRVAQEWIEEYRKFWDASFDRLDAYLTELQTSQKENS